jgi:hypothetical protein
MAPQVDEDQVAHGLCRGSHAAQRAPSGPETDRTVGESAAILRLSADSRSGRASEAWSALSEPHVIVGSHLRATPEGHVVLHLSGSGLATVTLRSARAITTRWLGCGRPRVVRIGMRRVRIPAAIEILVVFPAPLGPSRP